MNLHDILEPDRLAAHINAGNVRAQNHPTQPYVIYNYTEKCAYEGVWDDITRACRGLIVDTTTHQVIARPFRKFMNYGQAGAPDLNLAAPAIVTDKMDGSLGILYPSGDGTYAVATRGSFASDQAIHATELLRTRYADYRPLDGLTVLVEIVYPQNRIVVDYGDINDLVLLGAVDIATGRSAPPALVDWPGPRTETFTYATLGEALAAEPRRNAEGLVVHCPRTDERVKIKQEDYVALHKIVTGLTARVVWQHLIDGKPLDDLVAPLPDEFHPWCRDVATQIELTVAQEMTAIEKAYAEVVAALPAGFGRKEFAAAAVPHPLKWALFLLLDGRDPRPELWKRAKPEPYLTPSGRTHGEDTA
ncbi:RNA ligase [Micromonospora sp. NPDC049891]|uniref:RNA ligase n=1 Tax=Micromonospora sp. NPDC049891 TaxID=3155655 RepID=UPI003410CA32